MNNKAMDLAISTLILIVLGILVLIAIIVAVTGGFDRFKDSTNSFLDTAQAASVKTACEQACQTNVKISYCCQKHTIEEKEIYCNDSRLQVSCPQITCEPNFCTN